MCIAVIFSPYFLCVLRILYSLQALLQCVAINILLTVAEKKVGERPRTRNSIRLSAFFSFIYRRTNKPRGQKTINDKKILQNVPLSSSKLPSSFLEKEESIQSISDASSPNQTRIFMFTLHKLPNDATIWQAKEGVLVGSLGIRFIRSSEVGRGIRVLSHLTAWLLPLPQHRKCGCLIFNGLFPSGRTMADFFVVVCRQEMV